MKNIVYSRGTYWSYFFGGLGILTTTLPTGLVAGFNLVLWNFRGWANSGMLVLGVITGAWCFIAAPAIAIRAYIRARKIRLAMKADGTWSKK